MIENQTISPYIEKERFNKVFWAWFHARQDNPGKTPISNKKGVFTMANLMRTLAIILGWICFIAVGLKNAFHLALWQQVILGCFARALP